MKKHGEGMVGGLLHRVVAQRRHIIAVVLVLALVAPVTVAALRSDGFDRTKVNLHDAGIWVMWQNSSLIGRINTETQQIDVSVAALSRTDDVSQHNRVVVINDPTSGQLAVLDTATSQPVGTTGLLEGSIVSIGGGAQQAVVAEEPPVVAGVVAPDGRVWVTEAELLHNLEPEVDEVAMEAAAGSVLAVDVFGTTHVFDAETFEVVSFGLSGQTGSRSGGLKAKRPAVTTVGRDIVVADLDARKIGLPNGKVVDLSAQSETIALQQAGPEASSVLVGTDRSLVEIDLLDGTKTVLHEKVKGGAVAPVRLGDCAHGAWSGGSAASVRICDGQEPEITDPQLMERLTPQDVLVFRVNRDRLVLNGLASGANLLFTSDEPVVIEDWSQAQSEEPPVEQEEVDIVSDRPECQKVPAVPRITRDLDPVGTRPGRTVVVPVLDQINVESDPCDVLRIELAKGGASGDVRVEVVDDGTALQVSAGPDAAGTIQLPYVLVGRNHEVPGTAKLVVSTDSANLAPVAVADTTSLIIGPNRSSVKHDVLANDSDPEGDALTLVNAMPDPSATDVQVSFQASGMIEVLGGSAATGDQKILYFVEDDRGVAAAEPGELMVRVQPKTANSQPTARADRLTAPVGRSVTVNLLDNDSDLDGDALTVVQVNSPSSIVTSNLRADTGEVTFTPETAAGSPFFFSYAVKDESIDPAVEGTIRVDVLPEGDRRAPVAVLDEVVARPGTPAVVDLTANDIGDDLLAVTSLVADDAGSEVEVELIDLHLARVTAPATFTDTETFTYTLDDGIEGHRTTGQLRVRPHWADVQNLPPVTTPDEVSLRAGTATSVAVLANDIDPEGEQLSLVPNLRADQLPADDALTAFVMRDQIHVVATAEASGTHRVGYTATDPEDHSVKDDSILVRIIGADEPNRPPQDPHLEGRVRAGATTRVRLPLVGIDPDGDVVSVTGLESPPRLGTVTFEGGEAIYEAEVDAAGTDRFSYRLDDGNEGGVTIAEAEIAVLPRSGKNRPPVAVIDEIDVMPGGSRLVDVLLNDTDADDDPLTIQTKGVDALTQPRFGTVELVEGLLLYTQDQGNPDVSVDEVLDGFTYGISDGNGNVARGQVSVRIRSEVPPVPPAARDDLNAPIAVGDTVEIDVLDNDFDPDDPEKNVTIEFPDLDRVATETGATIVANGPIVEVTASTTEPQSVVLPYVATDADGGTAEALVVVPVLADLPPVALPDAAAVDGGETIDVDVLANDIDPEQGGEPRSGLTVVTVAGERGAVAVTPASDGSDVSFTADPDAQGIGGFAYQIEDEAGNRTWGRATIEITGQNFPPTLADGEVMVNAGGESRLDLDGLADDQNPSDVPRLRYSAGTSSDSKITVSTVGDRSQTLVVAADTDANGATAAVPITVTDSTGAEQPATVDITVSPFEGMPPNALPDASRTIQDKAVTLNVVANDDPGTAGPIRLADSTTPSSNSGTVTASSDGQSLTFTPKAGFFGDANISYTIEDETKEHARHATAIWKVTVIGRPDRPLSPSGDPDDSKVYLSWSPPNGNGAPITGYQVRANPGGEVRTINHPGTTYTFDSLTNDRPYTFEVRALNEATESGTAEDNWSPPSQPYIPDVVPEAPGVPTSTFGDKQLKVGWPAAVSRGSRVNAYQLEIRGSDKNGVEVLGPVTSYTWGGLTNGNTYTFRVRAVNNRGEGDWSPFTDASSLDAVPAGTPLAPTSVTATPGDQQSIGGAVRVDWSWARAGQGNGAEAEAFTVSYAPTAGSGGSSGSVEVAGTTRSHLFSTLANGVTYRFNVHVRTKVGDGPSAAASARPSKRPTSVVSPAATNGDGRSRVTFGGSPADSYGPGDGGDPENFEYRVSTSPARAGGTLVTSSTSIDLTGLSNSVSNSGSYTITILACNSNGCSSPATVSNVRPFGLPGQPDVTGSRSGGTANYSWPAIGPNGRPIKGYEVRVGSGSWSLQTGRSVSRGIAPGETIRVCVRTVAQGNTSSEEVRSDAGCANVSRPAPTARVRRDPQQQNVTGCTGPPCYRVQLILTDVTPGTYTFNCHGEMEWAFTVSGSSWSGTEFGGPFNYCVTGRNINFTHTVTGPSGTVELSGRADGSSNYDVTRPFP